MRIAIFTNNYLPNPYGVAGSIESFRRQFEKRGHQVYIFAPFSKGYADKNSRVFRYPSMDLKYKISFPLPIAHSKKNSQALKNLDLDIIHSQHPNLLGTAALKWARRKNIPLVFTWHTLYDRYTNFVPLIPDKLAARWIIKKAVRYANKADQVVAPTKSVKKIIQNWGVENKNIAVIPTGVDEEVYQNPDGDKIRKKYGIRSDEVLLLLVSRLTEEKNVKFLFESVIKTLKSNNRVRFLVAGKGYLLKKLKAFAQGEPASGWQSSLKDKLMGQAKLSFKADHPRVGKTRIIFAGLVGKKEIKNYYAAADIFVYASLSETQGMVISEAMYGGLPIVAVRAPGAKDLVEEGINGFLVENNKNEFAEAVNKLAADKDLRKKFAGNSKRIARAKYTDAVCADKMLEVYKSLTRYRN